MFNIGISKPAVTIQDGKTISINYKLQISSVGTILKGCYPLVTQSGQYGVNAVVRGYQQAKFVSLSQLTG